MSLLILANRLFGLRAKLSVGGARVKSSLFQTLLRLLDLTLLHFRLATSPLLLHTGARAAPTRSRLPTCPGC